MADQLTTEAHRKRWAPRQAHPPFPVTIETITGQPNCWGKWPVYTGYFRDNQVYVKHTGDMAWLYKMGFFGKGSLSRGQPEFNKVAYSQSSGQAAPKVISKRRFHRHQTWQQRKAVENGDLDPEKVRDTDKEGQQRIKVSRQWYIPTSEEPASKRLCTEETFEEGIKSGSDWDVGAPPGYVGSDIWTPYGSIGVDSASQKETVLSVGAWGGSEVKDAWAEQEADIDFWCSEPTPGGDTVDQEYESGSCSKHPGKFPSQDVEHSSESESQGQSNEGHGQGHPDLAEGHSQGSSEFTVRTVEMEESEADNLTTSATPIGQLLNSELGSCPSEETSHTQPDAPPMEQEADVNLDAASREDDLDGDVLVVDDSGGEEDESERLAWRTCLKNDPFPIKEYSQLTLEEVFFLMYTLGCLRLIDEHENLMTISETWCAFCQTQRSFLPNYIVYHYYRSKGWVPKPGLKYGADLLLYKQGPPFYHSSYSILVRLVDEDTLHELPEFPQRALTWSSLAGVDRVIEHVAKSVVYCYVLKPSSLSTDKIISPRCIPEFSVKEVLLKRWVASQERQGKDDHS